MREMGQTKLVPPSQRAMATLLLLLWMVGHLSPTYVTSFRRKRLSRLFVIADGDAFESSKRSTTRRRQRPESKSDRSPLTSLESWRNIFDRDREEPNFNQLSKRNESESDTASDFPFFDDDSVHDSDSEVPSVLTATTSSRTQHQHNTDSRIIGGRPAVVGAYPSFVHTREPILCGGTLIHEDIVLTAAHCKGAFLAGVYIGGIQRYGSDGTFLEVEAEYPHPDFALDTQFNDIMLVKLDIPFTSTPVADLNIDPSRPVANDVLTVIGYGTTTESGSTSSELLEIEVDVFSDVFCFDLYRYYDPVTMVCAGSELGGRDSCQGDSGGPIYVAGKIQVGITSSGNGCGDPNRPAIYTEVSAYETFIRQGICVYSDNPPQSCRAAIPSMAPFVSPITIPTPSPTNNRVRPTKEPTISTLLPTSVASATLLPTSSPTSYQFTKSKKSKKSASGKGRKGDKKGKGRKKGGRNGKGKGKMKGQRRPIRDFDDDNAVQENQIFVNDDVPLVYFD